MVGVVVSIAGIVCLLLLYPTFAPCFPAGIVTRSQRPSPQQAWSEVPLPVKLVKLLLSDVTAALEAPEEEEEVRGEGGGEV